jgi:hypothetical protein
MAQADQIKKLETAPSVNYWTQQHGAPPAGATVEHPLAPQPLPTPSATNYSAEQQQQLQDKGGA